VRPKGLEKLKKYCDLIETRTHYLPACSIVPQPTTLPRARQIVGDSSEYIGFKKWLWTEYAGFKKWLWAEYAGFKKWLWTVNSSVGRADRRERGSSVCRVLILTP
jgi:hypothetical protein